MKLGIVATVNAALAADGRVERLRRARGYFQITGGVTERLTETGLYGWGPGATAEGVLADVRSRLADSIARGRYTHRERGYVLSDSKRERFERLYTLGWDAYAISRALIAPTP